VKVDAPREDRDRSWRDRQPPRRRLALGSDHGGFQLKQSLKRALEEMGHLVLDCGCPSPDPVDYPDIALAVGAAVRAGRADAGIMIDAAGIGSTMVLNRIPGIRAALCHDPMTTVNSRAHNDANLLVLGSRVVHPGEANRLVRLWLETSYEGGRHERRVGKIRAMDQAKTTGGNV
jgi:ribose 5-phosphate isomerase B